MVLEKRGSAQSLKLRTSKRSWHCRCRCCDCGVKRRRSACVWALHGHRERHCNSKCEMPHPEPPLYSVGSCRKRVKSQAILSRPDMRRQPAGVQTISSWRVHQSRWLGPDVQQSASITPSFFSAAPRGARWKNSSYL